MYCYYGLKQLKVIVLLLSLTLIAWLLVGFHCKTTPKVPHQHHNFGEKPLVIQTFFWTAIIRKKSCEILVGLNLSDIGSKSMYICIWEQHTDKGSEKLRQRERDNERKNKSKRTRTERQTEEEVEKSTRLNSAPPSSLYWFLIYHHLFP